MSANRRTTKPKNKRSMNLRFVRDFIRTLSADLQRTDTPSGFPSMYRADEGAIFLSEAETQQYQETLHKLVARFASNADLSQTTISNALQNAIFESLDIQARSSDAFSSRLSRAIDRLAQLALLPSEAHECLVEVSGLDPKSLPARFGLVKFIEFNKYQLSKLRRKCSIVGRSKSTRRQVLDKHLGLTNMLDRHFAVVTVDARDATAAIEIATRQLRSTVDSLNFFTDLIPGNHGWVFLPGDREQRGTITTAVKPDGSWHSTASRTRPLAQFSMKMLRNTKPIRSLVRSISGLLSKQRTAVEDLLLAAVQTAGRATVATRQEESFLLYAIALESCVLPQASQELSHRLSQRVARVRGRDAANRVRHSREIRKLYGIRSRIVHSGSYEIELADLNSMRVYAKTLITKTLSNPQVRKCRTTRQFEEWWERLELQ